MMNTRWLIPGTIKQGYLTKAPPLNKGTWTTAFKGWKRRWCILYVSGNDLFLQYYDDEESARGNSAPKSTVSLKKCSKVDVDLQHSSYKNVFAIHLPERIYYFSSTSHYEMTEWSDAICTYLKLEQREHNQQSLGVQPTSAMPVPSSPILLHHSTPPQIPITTIDSTYSVYSLSTPYTETRAHTLPTPSSLSSTSNYSCPTHPQFRQLPPPPPTEYDSLQQRSLPPPPTEYDGLQQRSLPPPPSEYDSLQRRTLPPPPVDDEEEFEPMAPLAPPRSPERRRGRSPPPPVPPPYKPLVEENRSPVVPRRGNYIEVPPVPPPRFASSTLPNKAVPNMYVSNPI